jgi:CRISPR-associated protein Csm3
VSTNHDRSITLLGRVFIRGEILAVTGLHIGGGEGSLAIGGVDMPVVRDPLTNTPYIPGSSLRGKLRSLTEKLYGLPQNFAVSRQRGKEVFVHTCSSDRLKGLQGADYDRELARFRDEFARCPACSIFGVTGDSPVPHPTALVVRDVFLSHESRQALERAKTDLPYSEVKWEATIDRVTSAAVPRQVERVPAGVVFDNMEMVYSIYGNEGIERLKGVLEAMQLLEDDYLGGQGSRGNGRIRFQKLSIRARAGRDYRDEVEWTDGKDKRVAEILAKADDLTSWLRGVILPMGSA